MWNVPLSAVTAVETGAGAVVFRGHADARQHGARRIGDRACKRGGRAALSKRGGAGRGRQNDRQHECHEPLLHRTLRGGGVDSRLDVAVPARAGKVYGAQPANHGLSESPGGTHDAVRACIPGRILRRAVRLVNWITQLEALVPAVRHRSQKRQSSGVVVRGFSLVWHDDPKGSYHKLSPLEP